MSNTSNEDILEAVRDLSVKVARVETKVDYMSEHYLPKVDEMYVILQKYKGAIAFCSVFLYITAPFIGAFLWLKDHFK